AREVGAGNARLEHELLIGLRLLPAALEEVLAARPEIAAAAWAHAPARRHWAVVGNGPNRLAASELRIKLSELAYKSIACDATEDKKHIDLSSEPLILVCAPGLPPAAAADVGKELAIYRAHKAAPVVIATRGTDWPSALATIEVPPAHPQLAFVLSAMAGHLFGYEAALAIDAQARGLREIRAAVEDVAAALTRAIDELPRPVDAIRHQAKTVTVGISRSEEELFRAPLVAAALAAGAPRERLTYRVLRTLGALGPAVEEVVGFTRYRIDAAEGAAPRIFVTA